VHRRRKTARLRAWLTGAALAVAIVFGPAQAAHSVDVPPTSPTVDCQHVPKVGAKLVTPHPTDPQCATSTEATTTPTVTIPPCSTSAPHPDLVVISPDCATTTATDPATTVPPTTHTTPAQTTTTLPPTVGTPTGTTAAASTTPAPTVPQLAHTGASVVPWAIGAGVMLSVGWALIGYSRRTRRSHKH
jgi:LPXTG-motif cell wall-anchored protein